ncbi:MULTISPECIES: tRNA pseudouridine(38-40) synthase TruA [unclassified Butyrivibrio]|uniref:tRNA pseudouridine(38-40) synthase TruA n=1 Tax=unclassified Butyrivibrio TaxID=2639466 RepID=UPI0003B75F1B|nr:MULTISPECIES: tRNA pseudouridine(38-40) synthase TruA [unclassified Butyrivibrio]
MKNIMLTVAYDGSGYHGFAFQENTRTIEGELKNAVDALTGEDSEIIGASRTDAGVHAYGNLVVFKTESTIPAESFAPALNNKLPDDIRIMRSEEVPLEFHPRKCLSEKTYEYRILNVKTMVPTKRLYFCHNSYPLDEKRMNEAAKYLVGEHDFSSFCAAGSQALSHVRRIISAEAVRQGDEIVIRITGNGFLYNMVRIIAGTLMEIGRGKGESSDVEKMIGAKDRAAAGPTAPPQGLFLIEYRFPEEL